MGLADFGCYLCECVWREWTIEIKLVHHCPVEGRHTTTTQLLDRGRAEVSRDDWQPRLEGGLSDRLI